MEPQPELDFQARLDRIEKKLKLLQLISVVIVAVLAASGCIAWRLQMANQISGKVLRVRGLVVEDQNGRDRVLIGAPIPRVAGRRRDDEMAGVLVLGENGADRVAIAADPTPNPQTKGTVRKRIGTGAGLYVNDKDGNERGGFGVLDNSDRVTFGMDYPAGASEAIAFSAGANEASLQFKDRKTLVRGGLVERNSSAAMLYGLNMGKDAMLDLGIVRLVPYSSRQLVIKANDADFDKALDNAQP